HVYATQGLDTVRVTVTNNYGRSGADSLAVQAASPGAAVLVGAGDIADSSKNGDSLTANLLDGIAGTVFTLGDNAYQSGTGAARPPIGTSPGSSPASTSPVTRGIRRCGTPCTRTARRSW